MRTFLVMLVVAVGIGLFIRFQCKDEKKPERKPAVVAPVVAPPPPPADAAVGVEPEVVEPPVVDDPPPPSERFEIGALSADGTRALLVTLGAPHLRVVVVDTGAVETDVELPALAEIEDVPSEAVLGDLVRARAVLRGFPLGTHRFSSIASSSDGARGAFNIGDPLHLVNGDKLGAKLALPAAYMPMVTADGTLLMRGYDGRLEDEGKYALFAVPLTGGKPKKVPGTDGYGGWWVVKEDVLRIVVSHGASIPTCVVDVPLTKPYRVTSKACPEGATYDGVALSPSGAWIAWSVDGRARSMNVATKQVVMDVEEPGNLTISDDGHVVFGARVWDPATQEVRDLPQALDHSCVFRTATELICPEGRSVRIVRL